jgi:hypothetical protein
MPQDISVPGTEDSVAATNSFSTWKFNIDSNIFVSIARIIEALARYHPVMWISLAAILSVMVIFITIAKPPNGQRLHICVYGFAYFTVMVVCLIAGHAIFILGEFGNWKKAEL